MSSEGSTPHVPQVDAETVIRMRGISKCYQIYARPEDRLKQSLLPRIQSLLGRPRQTYFREFWALHDVSFEVRKGETLGVIGRNGSGKSTLLQILCGTLTPTQGEVDVVGRVAALLELGSGFNPEFTGHENVYMSGAVLGLTRDEIDARYEAIVEFAEIGEFIGQPVKTYSSGMYVRLAFAVIAHADADILVIDEALSVGDAVFTQKCKRFLRTFIQNGTLIFVSHDVSSVLSLCESCLWLDKGIPRMYSNAKDTVNSYMRDCMEYAAARGLTFQTVGGARHPPGVEDDENPIDAGVSASFFEDIANAEGWKTGNAELMSVQLADLSGNLLSNFSGGEMLELKISAMAHESLDSPIIGFIVKDRLGQSLFGEHTFGKSDIQPAAAGQTIVGNFVFSLPMLPSGDYSMTVSVADGTPQNHVQHHWLHDAVTIKVVSERERHGLVGIPFKHVGLAVI